ncbi:MAG: GTP-binding protein [Porticoccus sp.]|jgi:GTP-binding protein
MKPVIALVGRPNVGKSTLFNRLTNTRDALVANFAGLTRDRKYGEAHVEDNSFIVIDTGGITGEEEGLDFEMAKQSLAAIDEADIVFFLVDAKAGVTAADSLIAEHLRRQEKPVYVLVNKTDGINPDVAMLEFYELGLAELRPVAASQGRGIKQLMAEIVEHFGVDEAEQDEDESRGIKIGIIGRPNVGKSTLVNRLLGEERVIVFDHPGTTRDSIYIDYERHDKPYTLIDTAGVRRRKNVSETVEKFSIIKTLKAIDDSNVVILVIDAQEGIVDQDLHILSYAIDSGRALVIALNKWDGMDNEKKDWIRNELERRLRFLDFAKIHFISALHGTGVGNLYESVEAAYEGATKKLSTPMLTRILQDAVADHQPPMVHGRRIKLRYAHAGGSNPPIIVIHGNQVEALPDSYKKFLEKTFRKVLDMSGTPIRIELRSSENPFQSKRNTLTPRQQTTKRKRLIKDAQTREEADKIRKDFRRKPSER